MLSMGCRPLILTFTNWDAHRRMKRKVQKPRLVSRHTWELFTGVMDGSPGSSNVGITHSNKYQIWHIKNGHIIWHQNS